MRDMLYILGTCSGTEPFPGRRHVAFVIEHNGGLYWFDAGDGCAYTACMMGLTLTKLKCVFISHPHMDHVGNLGELLWTVRKLNGFTRQLDGGCIELFTPTRNIWAGFQTVLSETEGRFEIPFEIKERRVSDGVIYARDGIEVSAMHNAHMGVPDDGIWKSYSYLITVGGKSIAYSGDVHHVSELLPFIKRADVLMMETGHHRPKDVCKALMDANAVPAHLLFIHHGRALLDEPEKALAETAFYTGKLSVLDDATRFDISQFIN